MIDMQGYISNVQEIPGELKSQTIVGVIGDPAIEYAEEMQGCISDAKEITGEVNSQEMAGTILAGSGSGIIPIYGGPCEVTPAQYQQILYTAGFEMTRNVVVNPIPQNYGLITYNGYHITVS